MNLTKFILAAIAAFVLLLTCRTAGAQQTSKVYRVGALFNGKPDVAFETLRKELARLGYVEGTNVVFEARFAEGQLDRLPGFAAELVNKGVDVIATYGGPATIAARKASTTIPIVAALVADPVAIGVAATLERPGGNVTGITNNDPELASRQLGILKALFPKLARVAILSDSDIPGADASGLAPIERANVTAARAVGIAPQVLKVHGPTPDFDTAFNAMVAERAEVLLVLEVPAPFRNRKRIAELAAAHRIPTMYWGGASDAGGLMAYGTTFTDTYPRMPIYVDRILKGAKPADVPFEVISRREFVINLKTARELGLTIPAEVLKHADRVID
ncbi:ABC transporter substrate-binding protein [Pandoraea terrae]|uniref:ABC transporter substrate-binding protein n=1 Tax=Pandoraea terrae TaxID=1537710 RepID=A0A5E4YNG8_9BURK|nr:ABC transporter substrate-binding protein [Pandoraea terrae]VVE50341.1 ABC transporter substrate-binding protein [Pandoraea terrae]